MEVSCAQCGRVYDVPEERKTRTIKCSCKYSFRPSEVLHQAKSSKESSDHKKDPNRTSFFEEKNQSEGNNTSKEALTDDKVDSFLNSLRTSHTRLKAEELTKRKKDDVKIQLPTEVGEIEIDDEKIKRSESPTLETKNLDLFDEASSTGEETEVSAPKKRKAIENEHYRESFARRQAAQAEPKDLQEKLQDFVRKPVGIASLGLFGASLLAIALSFFFFSSPEKKVQEDPYLSQLLQERTKTAQKPILVKNRAPIEQANQKIAQKNLKQQSEKKKLPKTAQKKKVNLTRLNYLGNYEGILQQVKTPDPNNSEEIANYYEAVFLHPKSSANKIRSALVTLKNISSAKGDSILVRSFSAGLIASKTSANIKAAIEQLQNLQLTRSKDPLVYAYLGLAYYNLNKPKLALTSWNQALTLNGSLAWVLKKKENYYRKLGKRIEAKNASTLISQIPEESHHGYRLLAENYLLEKNVSQASLYFQKSLEQEKSWSAHIALSKILLAKSPQQSLRQSELALEIAQSTAQNRESELGRAEAFCQMKQTKEAGYAFNRVLKIDPNYIRALEKKADCETKSKDFRSAANSYQRYLKVKPTNARIWFAYGQALEKSGKQRPAIAAALRSVQIKESVEAHLYLAKSFLKQQNKVKALFHATRAQQINPKSAEARKLIADLGN